MMDIEKIKQLREATGAGVMDAKQALSDANNEIDRAIEIIQQKGLTKAAKRADRATQSGIIYTYLHGAGQIGVLLELNCETSFVAQTDEFRKLAHELALQIASMEPDSPETLTGQAYVRDAKQTIQDLINALIAQTGENITVRRFARFAVNQE